MFEYYNKSANYRQSLFSTFKKVFARLERFVVKEDLNEIEKLGLIKSFEYNYDLSWKTLQDLLKEKGYSDIIRCDR